jgi:hypothetical protein
MDRLRYRSCMILVWKRVHGATTISKSVILRYRSMNAVLIWLSSPYPVVINVSGDRFRALCYFQLTGEIDHANVILQEDVISCEM